jgi:protein-tyrosine phosphatase
MKHKITICFVCTENISRSVAAEHCLKTYLKKHKIDDIKATSAGTTGVDSDVSGHCFAHCEELRDLGADISKHKRTQLTEELAERCDILIAMSVSHQEWIKANLDVDAPLFSELIDGSEKPVIIPPLDSPECEGFLRQMVKDFYVSMPLFVKNAREWRATEREL